MCGIVGMAGKIQHSEREAFEDMLIFSQVRGPHSTGVASVARHDGDTRLVKALGRPDMIIDYDKRWDKVTDFGKKFLLGHNRYATTGKINVKSAHPYDFENIVGCHNGTIPEYRLRDLKKGPTGYNTDSECVLANIDDGNIQEVFRTLAGAWAFVWYDRRNNTVNFLRNRDRYLCYCYSEDRETIFWASEKGFLDAALARNKIKHTTVYEVTEDMHTRWVIPDMNKPFEKARQSKIVSNEWNSGSSRFPANNHWDDKDKDFDVKTESKTGIVGPQNSGNQSNITQLHNRRAKQFEVAANLKNFDGQGYFKGRKHKDFYRGFQGEQLTKTQFEEATKDGCRWCDSTAEWGQPVRFIAKDAHICLECAQDEQVRHVCGVK